MRQVSTLQPDPRFKLDRQEALSGFIGFYRDKFGSKGYSTIDFLWQLYSILLMPNIGSHAFSFKALSKTFRESASQGRQQSLAKTTLFRLNGEKKFRLKAYLFGQKREFLANSISEILSAYRLTGGETFTAQDNEAALHGLSVEDYARSFQINSNIVLTGAQIAARINLPQRGRDIVSEAIQTASLEGVAGHVCLVIVFNIAFKEAEYLCQSPAGEIKNGNLYSFLIQWVQSNLGSDANASVAPYMVPMTKIAQQVSLALKEPGAKVTKRVNEDQILVDKLGQYLMMPEIDNTQAYEEELMAFGQKPDGSFSYDQGDADSTDFKVNDPNNKKKKLPINMPLFTDWVNRKFAYVNSSGNIAVLDLSSATPLNATHIVKLLDRRVKFDEGSILATALNLAYQTRPGFEAEVKPNAWVSPDILKTLTVSPAENLQSFIQKVANYHQKQGSLSNIKDYLKFDDDNSVTQVKFLTKDSPVTEFQYVGHLIEKAQKVLAENLAVIFRQYSVVTVLEALAVLHIVNTYSSKYEQVFQKDREDRKDYLEQGEDPNHKPDALPNFRKDREFLPHQAKIENITRRGPKFAIYEVDAGGGKTLLILSSILRELKAKKCVRPIIMCPAHLVSSYVHEAAYFTEGKVNIVPITNTVMKQHGEERLTQMIEKAPINTIFLTDFDFIKNKGVDVCYGNSVVTVYRHVEFLRKFEFDLVCVDECHYLRNQGSLRTRAAQSLMTEIPMKRLASGTFIADTLVDVASQFSLLDPTVFGTREQFIKEFAKEIRGDKVLVWKERAETLIRRKMSEHCVVATAKRKEWAAILPFPVEEFFGVELTENQRALYESILQQTMDMLREAIAKDPELKEALESNDDTKVEELEAKLKAYLARLEAFLSTPETDEAGKDFLLLPEDQVSPKVRKIYERIRHHDEEQIPGKILIFTNYVRAAESVYNNAPPDIKKRMILYTAANKAECKTQFETQDSKDIMVGVETSMNTGLNLQFVSRLIRMETVWTPGALEQGNARVNRPNVKKAETRANIYFDWIIINRTIDVTKISRLISKLVSKTKFDEYENPAYQAIEALPQIPMTLDTIGAHNDFKESLLPYLQSYEQLKQTQQQDFKEYRERNKGKLVKVPIVAEGLLEGSKLMTRVPYVPDMEIYGEDELGLVRYDQFVRQDMTSLDEDEGEGEDDTDAEEARNEQLRQERETMKGMPVHTQWGDGVITGLGKKRIRVLLTDGTRKGANKMAAYIITRSTTNSRDMRDALLKQVGKIPLTEPYEVPVEEGPAVKKRLGKVTVQETVAALKAEFDITVINDYLALSYRSGENVDQSVLNTLLNVGFARSFEYYYSWLKGPKNLIQLFQDWKDAGFVVDKKTSLLFQHIFQALKGDRSAGTKYGFATQMDLKNWVRSNIKPSSDPNEIHPYPISQDGTFYIALPAHNQAGTRRAIKFQPMQIRWHLGGGDKEILRFVTSAPEIIEILKQVKDAGIEITNIDELKEQYSSYKRHKPRA